MSASDRGHPRNVRPREWRDAAGAEVEGHAQPRCTSCPVPGGSRVKRGRESVGVYRSGVGDGTIPQQVRGELITAENRRTAQTFRLIIVIGSEDLKVVRF